jgi:Uma2 family endonuclease
MTPNTEFFPQIVIYPESDGLPMAESDQTRNYLVYATKVLAHFFRNRQDVYTSGNLFIYYEQGNPESVVAPDVFVVFGVEDRLRRTYKVWEEGDRTPSFVLEITSRTTLTKDQGAKKGIYALLGVEEYYQYDPTEDYLRPPLQGLRLVDDSYVSVPARSLADGTIVLPSATLGLELHLRQGMMRFYDPVTQRHLLTYEEEIAARQIAEERAQTAEERAQTAEERAQTAEERAQTAEERAERLAARLRELNIDPDAV